jgi:hypothetical protein
MKYSLLIWWRSSNYRPATCGANKLWVFSLFTSSYLVHSPRNRGVIAGGAALMQPKVGPDAKPDLLIISGLILLGGWVLVGSDISKTMERAAESRHAAKYGVNALR